MGPLLREQGRCVDSVPRETLSQGREHAQEQEQVDEESALIRVHRIKKEWYCCEEDDNNNNSSSSVPPSTFHVQLKDDSDGKGVLVMMTEQQGVPTSTTRATTAARSLSQVFCDWYKGLDATALGFGMRMGVSITASSLFTLIENPVTKTGFPEGMWVLITVLFVCWFPSLDAASVVEKSLQRIYGTLIGASAGLLCGFASLPFQASRETQAVCLAICIFVYTFGICWAAVQFKVKGTNMTIIARYNYACILCLLTFYICIMPFYERQDAAHHQGQWVQAIWRVVNVLIGCFLGAGLSLLIYPRSTVQILQRKIEAQITLAGQASMAVMHSAADTFSETAFVARVKTEPTIRRRISESQRPWTKQQHQHQRSSDDALHKHDAAIQDSWNIKSQLKMMQYDPFQLGTPDHILESYQKEIAHTLTRALRIQHTVVLIDGILRNDPKHDFSEFHIDLFATIGTLVGRMLQVPLDDHAAQELQTKMLFVRQHIIDLALVVASSSEKMTLHQRGTLGVGILGSSHHLMGLVEDDDDDNDHENDSCDDSIQEDDDKGFRFTQHLHGSRVSALLFLQLVEHLALRAVRLYQSWKECEQLCHVARYRENHKHSVRRLGYHYRPPPT